MVLTDSNLCSLADTFDIFEPGSLTVSIDSFSNVLCYGDSTGYIRLTTNGGTLPYTYTWSNGSTSNTTFPLSSNNYVYRVEDVNGCQFSDTIQVTQNPDLTISYSIENLRCFGDSDGRILLTARGGLGSYSFLWNDTRSQTTAIADSLISGIYTVLIQDSLGCNRRDTFTITEPSQLTLVVDSVRNVNCFGENNGRIDVSSSGGVGVYQFSFDNGLSWRTSNYADSLIASSYYIQLRDDSFCLQKDTVVIFQPSSLLLTLDSFQNVRCFGEFNGQLSISIHGGTFPYQINWQNGDTTRINRNLGVGSYWISVLDSHGCGIQDTFLISEPARLTSVTNQTNNLCAGDSSGSASVTVSGGVTPYNYLWDDRLNQNTFAANNLLVGQYSVRVLDANGCVLFDTVSLTEPSKLINNFTSRDVTCHNGNNGEIRVASIGGTPPYRYLLNGISQPSSTFTNLDSNAYLITILDLNNCRQDTTILLSHPNRIGLEVLLIDTVNCFGETNGSFQVRALSPQGLASYTMDFVNYVGTGLFRSLSSSTYEVFVRDDQGCVDSTEVFIPQPLPLNLSVTFQNPLCFQDTNGQIRLMASGGTTPYRYSIDRGSTFQSSPDFINLGQANYYVFIADNNGCTKEDTVIMIHPPLLVLDHTVTPTSCFDAKDGSITFQPSGGTLPYINYLVTTDLISYDTFINPFVQNLEKGKFILSITDINGCIAYDTATVTSPAIDTFLVYTDSTTCFSSTITNGSIYVLGAVNPPYKYSIDNGVTYQSSGNFYSLPAGPHTIITENRCGCKDTLTSFIFSPGPFSLSINPDTLYLDLGGQSSISVSTFNVINPSYVWSPLTGISCSDCLEPIFSPHESQEYTLRLTDHRSILSGENCFIEGKVHVIVDLHKRSYLPNAFSPNGDGVNDEWYIFGEGIKSISMFIYDRWGEKVFENNNALRGWNGYFNGVLLNPGVYAYFVEVEYLDNLKETYQGSVSLIR